MPSGVAAGILEGLLGGYVERKTKERDQQEKLAQIIATARAEQQAKSEFDPESRAKASVLSTILGIQPPQPMGGYNSQEVAANIPQQVGQANQLNQASLLQKYGLLPKAPVSLEEIFAKAEAGAAGRAAGTPPKPPKELTPQQKAVRQNFADLSAGLDRIDTMLKADTGFKGQLFATGIPFQPGAGGLADELGNASDVLLRMRSGAAINPDEYKRLRKLLPHSSDALSEWLGNPDRARQKLVKFKQSVQEILNQKVQADAEMDDDDAEWIANLEAQGLTVTPAGP